MESNKVCFWLITYKDVSKVPALLESFRQCPLPHDVRILDNSCDPTVESQLREMVHPGENLTVSNENFYCCGGSQALLQVTDAPIIAYLCSTHTEINDPTWIEDAVSILDSDPKMGMVGHLREMAGLYYYQSVATGQPDASKPIPGYLPLLEGRFDRMAIFEEANHHIHVQGGAWVARREALLDIGGFETKIRHLFMDVELSIRLQCYGWKLGQAPTMFSEYWAGHSTPNHRDYKLAHFYREA